MGQNRAEHHTHLYHGDELIIRRGQTFQIEVELSRPFNPDTDKLHLDMKTGTGATHLHMMHPDPECSRMDQILLNKLMLKSVFRQPGENVDKETCKREQLISTARNAKRKKHRTIKYSRMFEAN